jgi:hypothetical protein
MKKWITMMILDSDKSRLMVITKKRYFQKIDK